MSDWKQELSIIIGKVLDKSDKSEFEFLKKLQMELNARC